MRVRAYTIGNGTLAVRIREMADSSSDGARKLANGDTSDGPGVAEGLRAAFLDRDGVINNSGHYVNSEADFHLLPGAAAAIRRLNEADLPVVVVTNQGSIALEYLTLDELGRIHDKMDSLLAAEGAHVDAVYAALTYPTGTMPDLACESHYRKPSPGMLEQAREDLGIDLDRSTMVGDATTDILAGQRAGCRTILVQTGFGGEDGWTKAEPDAVVADLTAAVRLILGEVPTPSG